MTLYEYQKQAITTLKTHQSTDLTILRMVLGLVGESGEIAEKFKKWMRDGNMQTDLIDRSDITKELGDVLWYIAALADVLGISMDEIAQTNLSKLQSRAARGVIEGSGDNR